MKITVIGTGYVGLVTGTCFAEIGMEVTCVDNDPRKISMLRGGEIPIHEPGLFELVEKNTKASRLFFTESLKEAIENADIVFLAVGTPESEIDGSANLSYLFSAVEELCKVLKNKVTVIVKSTVTVGTNQKIREIFEDAGLDCPVISNPEFLREGFAVYDFMNPDRIIIGMKDCIETKEVIEKLYNFSTKKNVPILYTSPESAELIKYASNAFLATKVAFINEISEVADKVGADIDEVALGMGLDKRIGKNFLKPGPGYGGSCFPKDTKALIRMAKTENMQLMILESVVKSNRMRKIKVADRIYSILQEQNGKNLTCFGLTFKANTDDVRESPAIDIVKLLNCYDINITLYDPVGMENAKEVIGDLKNIRYANDPYEAAEGADLIAVLTEWEEFNNLDYQVLSSKMRNKVIFDTRRFITQKDGVQIIH